MNHPNPYACIVAKLERAGVTFKQHEHAPVRTSQEAATIRGTSIEEGAKALVCHVDKSRYVLAVLSAAFQADLPALRRKLGAKKLALASPEEVLRETGCEVGGVPPFGSCIGLMTYCDPSLRAHEHISFNAGLRTHSIVMRFVDYLAIEQPTVTPFAKQVPGAVQ
ncbi:MAG: YbaK/EbsC family protein [bacterium]|nr:YbaK/EbsC family protein [bacterium]